MKRCAILAFALLLLCAAPASASSNRIIGGQVADPAEWPFYATLSVGPVPSKGNLPLLCGGSLVAPQWVLTAGHCVVGNMDQSAFKIYATFGLANRGQKDKESIRASAIFLHPEFSEWYSTLPLHDAALIKLARPSSAPPVSMAAAPPLAGSAAAVAGFGVRSETTPYPSFLFRQADTTVIASDVCQANLDAVGWQHDASSSVCAFQQSQGACYGDSGGPLVSGGELIGIVSGGVDCKKQLHPDVFAGVAGKKSWVDEVVAAGWQEGRINDAGIWNMNKKSFEFSALVSQKFKKARVVFTRPVCRANLLGPCTTETKRVFPWFDSKLLSYRFKQNKKRRCAAGKLFVRFASPDGDHVEQKSFAKCL